MKNIVKILLFVGCLSGAAYSQTTTPAKTPTKTQTMTVKPKPAETKTKTAAKTKPATAETGAPKTYIKGPKGGCYFVKGKNKVYVDKSKCQQ